MIHLFVPENFSPQFEVVSCFLENDGKILLLHRQGEKSEGGRWGLPAGKLEKGESREEALQREVFEETGVTLDSTEAEFLGTLSVTHGERDFLYHTFRSKMDSLPDVILNPREHRDFCWQKISESFSLPLVTDLDRCIRMYYPS